MIMKSELTKRTSLSAFVFRVPNANDDDRLQEPFSNTVIWRPSQPEQQNVVLTFSTSILLARFFQWRYSVSGL